MQFLSTLVNGGHVDEEAYNEFLKKLENETGSPEDALQKARDWITKEACISPENAIDQKNFLFEEKNIS